MFTRRTATVTISAPDASTARRVSSKSLYLPVPTISRERYSRPASTNGSFWAVNASPAADELDDLDLIAVADRARRVVLGRNDVAVHLDGDPPPGERQLREQVRDGAAVADRSLFAVHDRDHRSFPVTPNDFLYNRGFVS